MDDEFGWERSVRRGEVDEGIYESSQQTATFIKGCARSIIAVGVAASSIGYLTSSADEVIQARTTEKPA